jgi:type II secretory pathway pseudopilin PulG
MTRTFSNRGYLMVEVLISVVIFIMIVLSVFSTIGFITVRSQRSRLDTQASLILQEEMEVAYNVFLDGWRDYSSGFYYPALSVGGPTGNSWVLVSGKESGVETRFERWVEVSDVCRKPRAAANPGERVDCSGGELDLNSRMVKGIVEWTEREENKRIEADLLLVKTFF